MELWIDSLDEKVIGAFKGMGFLHGVTTNPSILARSPLKPREVIGRLLEIQQGPVAVQVMGMSREEILKEARALKCISPRLLPKIPVIAEGVEAMRVLHEEGIEALGTAVLSFRQAFLAVKGGFSYIAPYLGRFADEGKDPASLLNFLLKLKENTPSQGKIMAAGIRSLDHLFLAAEQGVQAATLPESIAKQLITIPEGAAHALEQFQIDFGAKKMHLFSEIPAKKKHAL